MEDGVPGHHGHPAVEVVVVEVSKEQDLVILLPLDMGDQAVMDQTVQHRHVTLELVQVSILVDVMYVK